MRHEPRQEYAPGGQLLLNAAVYSKSGSGKTNTDRQSQMDDALNSDFGEEISFYFLNA